MANYAPTVKKTAQARLLGRFQSNELRHSAPLVFLQFLRNSAIMLLSYQELLTREDRIIEAGYRKRTSRALVAGRSHTRTGTKGDSGILTPTFTTKADFFAVSMKQADNNNLSLEEMYADGFENVMINWAKATNTLATQYLFDNRSGVNVATQEGVFDAVDDVFDITETTHGDRAISIMEGVMNDNDYNGNYTIFCDNVSWNKFREQRAQGEGNSLNTKYQFVEGNLTFVKANEIHAMTAALNAAAGYNNGFWIAVPDGSISVLPWIPKQNRMGTVKKEATYSAITNPLMGGVTMAMFEREVLADDTANGGYTQDVLDEIEVSLTYSFNHAPSSTANETPILAFGLV